MEECRWMGREGRKVVKTEKNGRQKSKEEMDRKD